MAIPLAWQLSMQGADAIKQEFRDIQNELQKTGHWTEDLAKRQRILEQASNLNVRAGARMRNVFLASHPVLNNLTRAFSVFNSVLHAASTLMLLVNTATTNRNLAENARNTANVAQAWREYQAALAGTDTKKIMETLGNYNIALAEQKEAAERAKEANQNLFTSWAIGITGIISMFLGPNMQKIIATVLPKLGLQAASGFLAGLGGGLTGVGLGALFFPIIDTWLKSWNDGYTKWAEFRDTVMKKGIEDFFIITIPNAILTGVNMMNKFIVDGINYIVGQIAGFVNSIINKINKIAKKLGLKTIERLSFEPLKFTPIGGGGQQGATASQQGVSPATHPWLGSAGGSVVNNVTVQGSIWSKEEFNKAVGEALKAQLLQRGFQ